MRLEIPGQGPLVRKQIQHPKDALKTGALK